VLKVLAEALGTSGRTGEGLAAVRTADSVLAETGERFVSAELARVRGELLAQAGDVAGSARAFREAVSTAGAQGSPTLELRATLGWARAEAARDARDEGFDSLARLCDASDAERLGVDRQRALALLAGVTPPP
jgi:predicted ATPase